MCRDRTSQFRPCSLYERTGRTREQLSHRDHPCAACWEVGLDFCLFTESTEPSMLTFLALRTSVPTRGPAAKNVSLDRVRQLPELPVELWPHIFDLLVESLPHKRPPRHPDRFSLWVYQFCETESAYNWAVHDFLCRFMGQILTLGMVCRRWRYWVTSLSPQLWHRIYLYPGYVEAAKLFFERSGQLGLEIHYTAVSAHDFSESEVNLMASLFKSTDAMSVSAASIRICRQAFLCEES